MLWRTGNHCGGPREFILLLEVVKTGSISMSGDAMSGLLLGVPVCASGVKLWLTVEIRQIDLQWVAWKRSCVDDTLVYSGLRLTNNHSFSKTLFFHLARSTEWRHWTRKGSRSNGGTTSSIAATWPCSVVQGRSESPSSFCLFRVYKLRYIGSVQLTPLPNHPGLVCTMSS